MKFDEVRAWKDENYREALSEEQMNALSTNPAGALEDEDLADVFGGDYSDGSSSAAAASANNSGAFFSRHKCHSWGLTCDINLFSLDVNILALTHIIDIGSSDTQVCINND